MLICASIITTNFTSIFIFLFIWRNFKNFLYIHFIFNTILITFFLMFYFLNLVLDLLICIYIIFTFKFRGYWTLNKIKWFGYILIIKHLKSWGKYKQFHKTLESNKAFKIVKFRSHSLQVHRSKEKILRQNLKGSRCK